MELSIRIADVVTVLIYLERNVPVNYEADVVVIGGGIAGVSEFLSIQIHIS